jgi:hypothetical protein
VDVALAFCADISTQLSPDSRLAPHQVSHWFAKPRIAREWNKEAYDLLQIMVGMHYACRPFREKGSEQDEEYAI